MNNTICVDTLVKQYGTAVPAVDGISFEVAAGEVFGFLGPNGAGKSTTVSILTTLSMPSDGRAWVGGYDVATQAAQVRAVAGVALQEIGIDPLMTATELLVLQCRLFGLGQRQAQRRTEELLHLVRLHDVADRLVNTYSGGMRRRLDLALALAHEPLILFLDEPTTGLDPASRRDIWAEVRRLNNETGMTIFLTTQYLEEADALADRVAIINRGQIVADGTPAALKAAFGDESITLTFADAARAEQARAVLTPAAQRAQRDRHTLRLYLSDAAGAVPCVVNTLQQAGMQPAALTLAQPTLDDVFLAVTGQQFAVNEPITNAVEAALA